MAGVLVSTVIPENPSDNIYPREILGAGTHALRPLVEVNISTSTP
jgi:hypothetical protein